METNVLDERLAFVRDFESGHWSMTELCERYGVTRPTGYKWLARHRTGGEAGLPLQHLASLIPVPAAWHPSPTQVPRIRPSPVDDGGVARPVPQRVASSRRGRATAPPGEGERAVLKPPVRKNRRDGFEVIGQAVAKSASQATGERSCQHGGFSARPQ